VTERGVAEVVRNGRGLHHHVVQAAEPPEQLGVLPAEQHHGDGPGDGGDLDRVGEPVVHHAAGGSGRHHLGDLREPGEGRGEADPFQIGAEL
jgi:hypothetical protein